MKSIRMGLGAPVSPGTGWFLKESKFLCPACWSRPWSPAALGSTSGSMGVLHRSLTSSWLGCSFKSFSLEPSLCQTELRKDCEASHQVYEKRPSILTLSENEEQQPPNSPQSPLLYKGHTHGLTPISPSQAMVDARKTRKGVGWQCGVAGKPFSHIRALTGKSSVPGGSMPKPPAEWHR